MSPAGKRRAARGRYVARDLSGDPLVSVVLPTYNRARTLPRAMASVLNQSYRNVELLVVDDASSDNTEAVVKGMGDRRVRYIRLAQNGGASHARNAGLREAKGALIAFQDSDDEWLADKLERQVRAAQGAGQAAVTVFHPKIIYGRDDQARYGPHRVCCIPAVPEGDQDFIRLIHRENPISPQALMISRDAFETVGYFDEDLVNNEDWMYGISLFYATKVVFVSEPLVINYLQGDSISRLMRPGVRAQLRVVRRLRRLPEAEPKVIAGHLARIGWSIAKLGRRGLASRVLQAAIRLNPMDWKTWARLAAVRLGVVARGQGAA